MKKTYACNKEGTKLFFSGPSFVPSFLSLCCFFPLWVAMAASAGEVRHLFRALLREASRFSNYNVREYVKRRAIDAFHQYRDQSDPAVVDAAFKRGLQQLEIARRQSLVYSLYGPRVKSIMHLRSSK
jgi:hypothetical protein